MPTGVALQDPRERLFAAAERVLVQQGASALSSRSVTAEAGVAKGVLHRYFPDFDTFLAELVRERIRRLDDVADALRDGIGRVSVVANLTAAMCAAFDPVAVAVVALVSSRDGVRAILREGAAQGLPLLREIASMVAGYLAAECDRGCLTPSLDADAMALSVVGTMHLLFAGGLGASPDRGAVAEVLDSILVGVLVG